MQAAIEASHRQLGRPAAASRDHLANRFGASEVEPAV